jgi:hypothetical protein
MIEILPAALRQAGAGKRSLKADRARNAKGRRDRAEKRSYAE